MYLFFVFVYIIRVIFSLKAFKVFFIDILSNSIIAYPRVIFLIFLVLRFYWTSWNCKLIIFFWQIWPLVLQIFFLFFHVLPSFCDSNTTYFKQIEIFIVYLCPIHFSYLCFISDSFLLTCSLIIYSALSAPLIIIFSVFLS